NNSQRIQKLEAHDKEQDKRISENNERAMAGVASALAVTGLHYTDSANSIAAGAGNYGGQSAVSVGYSHQWGTSARFSVQNSVDTTGNVGTSASVAIGW
ncbi:UNVERIFIED_CONTAM: YadA C-terminal domain-containing protein, partial [Kocuria sp. CPCC 205274]